MASLVEPGEKVLIGNSGIWGTRAAEIARRYSGSFPLPPRPRTPQHVQCLWSTRTACRCPDWDGAVEGCLLPGWASSRSQCCPCQASAALSMLQTERPRTASLCSIRTSMCRVLREVGQGSPDRYHCCGLFHGKMITLAAPPAFPQAQLSRVPGGLPV